MHGRLSGRSFNDFSKCASILAQTHILTFQCNRENDLKNIKYFLCPLQQSTLKSHQWIKKDQENKSAQEGGTRRRTIEGTRGETGEKGNEKGGKEKRKAIRPLQTWFSGSYTNQIYRDHTPVKERSFLL